MRIVSYNILDGGGERANLLADVIEAQRPDVVCLVEAEDLSVVKSIAGRLKMRYVHAPGKVHASALLACGEIGQPINHAMLHPQISTSFLQVSVRQRDGSDLAFGIVHLHARPTEADECEREKEIAAVLQAFEPLRIAGRTHVLAGDFNSSSPVQKINPSRCKPQARDAWEKNGGYIPRRVVQTILNAGYLDSLQQVDPTAAETVGTFSTEFPGQRVDYIFTFGISPGVLRQAWVEQGMAARAASDHYPIGLEMRA